MEIQNSPKTWSSTHLDTEINALKAKGDAQTTTDAIQLEALGEIKNLNAEIEKLTLAQDPAAYPRLMAASKELDAANWKYENPLQWSYFQAGHDATAA